MILIKYLQTLLLEYPGTQIIIFDDKDSDKYSIVFNSSTQPRINLELFSLSDGKFILLDD